MKTLRMIGLALILTGAPGCALITGLEGDTTDGGGSNNAEWKWQGAVQIDHGLANGSDTPRLAYGQGAAWVVWSNGGGSPYVGSSWVTNRVGNGAWATPVELPGPGGDWDGGTFYPQIAVGKVGNPVVIMEALNAQDETAFSLWATPLTNGLSVSQSALVQIDEAGSMDAELSEFANSIAVDESGNIVVAWGDNEGFWARVSAGTAWSSAQQIGSANPSGYETVSVAASSGAALLGFSLSSSTEAQAATISNGSYSAMGNQETLPSLSSSAAGPLMALRGSKGMAASYSSSGWNGTPYSSGEWGTSVAIDDPATSSYHEAALALNANGEAVLVWQHDNGGSAQFAGTLYGSVYVNGQWSTPSLISLGGMNRECWFPAVDINDDGTAIAAWSDLDASGTYTRIWENTLLTVDGVATWQGPTPVDVASPDAGLATSPYNVRWINVALDPAGSIAYVTYEQEDPDGTPRVWANWAE